MTTPTNPISNFTPFLPSTFNVPEEEDRIRSYIGEKFSQVSDVVNDKMIGAFTQNTENYSGAKFAYDTTTKIRNGFQAIARIKSFIPQTIPLPIMDVNPQLIMSHVYGTASLPCSAVGAGDGDYFSFFCEGSPRVQFSVSDTQIIITTNGTTANYQGFIILSYVRDGI